MVDSAHVANNLYDIMLDANNSYCAWLDFYQHNVKHV